MIGKLLTLICMSMLSISYLQSATPQNIKDLHAAIEQSDKAAVQRQLIQNDFTLEELQTAWHKAMTKYRQEDTFISRAGEILSFSLPIAGILSSIQAARDYQNMNFFTKRKSEVDKIFNNYAEFSWLQKFFTMPYVERIENLQKRYKLLAVIGLTCIGAATVAYYYYSSTLKDARAIAAALEVKIQQKKIN